MNSAQIEKLQEQFNAQLVSERKQLEGIMERNLSAIDKLIEDKKGLCEQIDELQNQLSEQRLLSEKQLSELQKKHELEISQQKMQQLSTERARKEKWMAEKTKEIREMTIKGLEPEIERLIEKNKLEIK